MDRLKLESLNAEYIMKKPEEIMRYLLERMETSKIALASSLSIEDQVLTDMILKIDNKARIFFIDTGRHFQKTYDLMEKTREKYRFNFEVYAPESSDLEALTIQHGSNPFYESIELRKRCCEARKVKPLKRVLNTLDGWICGLRREQSSTRLDINLFEWDSNHSIYKFNPIAFWSEEMVWEYIKKENMPYNNLYKEGFRSIGCQPCTRAITAQEDVRNGRWWWEDEDKKECGLHPHTDKKPESFNEIMRA